MEKSGSHPIQNIFFRSIDRAVVVLEVISTGFDIEQDKIIRINLAKHQPGIAALYRTYNFNPEILIPTGIQDKFRIEVRSQMKEESFATKALELSELLKESDFIGANIQLDILLLEREFNRAGVQFSAVGSKIINPIDIWLNLTISGLDEACRYYLDQPLESLSGEFRNIIATERILDSQIRKHELEPTVDSLYANGLNKSNVLHMVYKHYSDSINQYKLQIGRKELNTDISSSIVVSKNDVGRFLELLDERNISIEFGKEKVKLTSRVNNIQVELMYSYFLAHGLDIKPALKESVSEDV